MAFKNDNFRMVSIVLAALILGIVGTMYIRDRFNQTARTGKDMPPTIEFAWTPIGRPYLEQIRGKVHIVDDHGIDFTSYSMKILEANKELGLPIPGLTGKDYTQDISFVQFAGNVDLLRKGEFTVEFRIKDDTGQETVLDKVVKFRNDFKMPALEFGVPTQK